MFKSGYAEFEILDATHTDQPQRYNQNQCNDDLEKPITCSFSSSFDGETLSKAFEKLNCNNSVAKLLVLTHIDIICEYN